MPAADLFDLWERLPFGWSYYSPARGRDVARLYKGNFEICNEDGTFDIWVRKSPAEQFYVGRHLFIFIIDDVEPLKLSLSLEEVIEWAATK